jgi:vacuolar iron transporter family protein
VSRRHDPTRGEGKHADVTGGWLRPAVFGVMDGLVSNFALIAGMAGGIAGESAASGTLVLAGLAGLAAGAFSMSVGEYTSVALGGACSGGTRRGAERAGREPGG